MRRCTSYRDPCVLDLMAECLAELNGTLVMLPADSLLVCLSDLSLDKLRLKMSPMCYAGSLMVSAGQYISCACTNLTFIIPC